MQAGHLLPHLLCSGWGHQGHIPSQHHHHHHWTHPFPQLDHHRPSVWYGSVLLKMQVKFKFQRVNKTSAFSKLKELGQVLLSNKIYVRLFLKYNSATLEILSERWNFQRRTFPSQLSGWSNPVWAMATTCLLTQSTAKHYFVSHWPFVISLKHNWGSFTNHSGFPLGPS